MEEEEQDASTPFWLQSRRNNTYFRRTTSLGGRAAAVATQFFFLAAAVILVAFFIIPPFVSSVSQIFRPHLIRKGWDYLNLVLVLFAVVCGFLSRSSGNDGSNQTKEFNSNSNDVASSYEYGNSKYSNSSSFDRGRRSNSATPRYWYDDRGVDQYSGQTVYKRFARSRSNSYPDLRLREYEEEERWRFYDDTRVYDHRFDGPDRIYQSYRSRQDGKRAGDEDQSGGGGSDDREKVEVAAATAELQEVAEMKERLPESTPLPKPAYPEAYPPSAPPAPPPSYPEVYPPSGPPAPPSPPPYKPVKRRTKRVYQDPAPKTERKERADPAVEVPEQPPLPPTPPPAPPSPPPIVYKKSKKKRGGATKDFLIALRRRKTKQRQQSVDGLDLLFGSDPSTAYSLPSESPANPPPPPPPPPPFFQGLFSSKKGKSKRTYSTPPPSAPSPPPPPPPPPRRRVESRSSAVNIHRAALESRVTKSDQVTAFNRREEIIVAGNKSPLLPIPPPPPAPPFKLPVWKFVKQGDYVRMASDISLRSGSSDDPDDPDAVQSDDGEKKIGGDSPASLFCPSPDVDTKADNFIARFRAGLRLEKMNSVGRSNLGPEPEYEPGSEIQPGSRV